MQCESASLLSCLYSMLLNTNYLQFSLSCNHYSKYYINLANNNITIILLVVLSFKLHNISAVFTSDCPEGCGQILVVVNEFWRSVARVHVTLDMRFFNSKVYPNLIAISRVI